MPQYFPPPEDLVNEHISGRNVKFELPYRSSAEHMRRIKERPRPSLAEAVRIIQEREWRVNRVLVDVIAVEYETGQRSFQIQHARR